MNAKKACDARESAQKVAKAEAAFGRDYHEERLLGVAVVAVAHGKESKKKRRELSCWFECCTRLAFLGGQKADRGGLEDAHQKGKVLFTIFV